MPFTQEDFKMKQNHERLSMIIMKQMGKSPLLAYNSLTDANKKKFNRLLNEYINQITVGDANWREQLKRDADELIAEDVFHEDFKPEKVFVPNIDPKKELLLSEEQREFFSENQSEFEKIQQHLGV